MTSARPRPAISIARVTTIGWIPKRAVITPLITPIAPPAIKEATVATRTPWGINTAAVAAATAITDPTERSMPPAAITSVKPVAASTVVVTCTARFDALAQLTKFGVNNTFPSTRAMSASRAPYLGPYAPLSHQRRHRNRSNATAIRHSPGP